LFVNCIDENNIASKSKEWKNKKNKLKTSLAENRCGCSSHVFPFMGISSVGFSSTGLYFGYL
jgi:hypothetical protein